MLMLVAQLGLQGDQLMDTFANSAWAFSEQTFCQISKWCSNNPKRYVTIATWWVRSSWELGSFASRLTCFVRWSWAKFQRPSQVENLAAQHNDPTASKFSCSLPCPPGSPRFGRCRSIDRGVCFEAWYSCLHVWKVTVHSHFPNMDQQLCLSRKYTVSVFVDLRLHNTLEPLK